MPEHNAHRVTVTDIDLPFGSLVRLMTRMIIASIPAAFLSTVIVFGVMIGGIVFLGGISGVVASLDKVRSEAAPPPTPTPSALSSRRTVAEYAAPTPYPTVYSTPLPTPTPEVRCFENGVRVSCTEIAGQ